LGYGHSWPLKIMLLPHMLAHQTNFVTLGHTVGRGSEKFFRTLWPHPLGCGAWLTLRNKLLHLCYQAKFVHSRSNHTSVITEIRPKNLTLYSKTTHGYQVNLLSCIKKSVLNPKRNWASKEEAVYCSRREYLHRLRYKYSKLQFSTARNENY